jgi:hypothetical protein
MRYGQSIKEDEEILKKNSVEHHLSVNEFNCIRYRQEEKSVLHDIIMMTNQVLPILVDDITVVKAREIVSKTIYDERILAYINASIVPLVTQHEQYIKKGGELSMDALVSNARPQHYQ